MSPHVYPLALEAMLGSINGATPFTVGALTVVALDGTYVYSDLHQFAADLTGQLGTPALVNSVFFTGGALTADDPSIPDVNPGEIVAALAYYNDDGNPATSQLIVFTDENADTTPMNYTGDGNPITVQLPSGLIATI